jgi:hypothetical protein
MRERRLLQPGANLLRRHQIEVLPRDEAADAQRSGPTRAPQRDLIRRHETGRLQWDEAVGCTAGKPMRAVLHLRQIFGAGYSHGKTM